MLLLSMMIIFVVLLGSWEPCVRVELVHVESKTVKDVLKLGLANQYLLKRSSFLGKI